MCVYVYTLADTDRGDEARGLWYMCGHYVAGKQASLDLNPSLALTGFPEGLGCSAGGPGSVSGSGRCPGEGMTTHSSILSGESQAQRSLVGYSPWGHKESDTTEPLAPLHCGINTVLFQPFHLLLHYPNPFVKSLALFSSFGSVQRCHLLENFP